MGCSVDARTLSSAAGGTSSNAGSGNGGGISGQSFGNGGSGSRNAVKENVPIPRCDYSQDITPNCATLAKNPGFTSDVADWNFDGGVFTHWRDLDANESMTSGSVDVLNTLAGTDPGVAPGTAWQCFPATPGNAYDLAADVFIEDGQGLNDPDGPYEGAAILGAFFFDDPSCQGTSVGFINAEPVTKTASWTHVTTTGSAPDLTLSISARLNAQKPIRESTFKATFDNVFVRER